MADPPGTFQRLKGRSFAETRGAVLDLIRSEGEISRTDLARRSALTEKTISGIVKSLIDSGVVVESGYAKSTGGKRPILLRLNDKELYAVGVALDVARCIIVLCAWQALGYAVLIFLVGIKNLPSAPYEAARIDGA